MGLMRHLRVQRTFVVLGLGSLLAFFAGVVLTLAGASSSLYYLAVVALASVALLQILRPRPR